MTLSSCSNDYDGPVVIELNIANVNGTYEITFLESSSVETETASNGSEVIIESSTSVADTITNAVIVFNTDGTYDSSGSFRIT